MFFYFGKQFRGAYRTERGKGRGLIAETAERPEREGAVKAASGVLIRKTNGHNGSRPPRSASSDSMIWRTQECSSFSSSK